VFNLFVRNHRRTRNRDTIIYYNIIISADIPQKALGRKVSQLNAKFRRYIISHRPVTGEAQFDTFREVNTQIKILHVIMSVKMQYRLRLANGNDVSTEDEK